MKLSIVLICLARYLAMASSATVTSKTNQVISKQNIGEATGTGMLRETNETIEATKFHFYRQKTRLSLKRLDTLIPRLESIQRNLSHLLSTSQQEFTLTFASYKLSQDTLERELSSMDNALGQNLDYFRAYRNLKDQLSAIHETLGSILMFSDVPENFGNNDFDELIELIQTTFPPTEVTTLPSTEIPITIPQASIIVHAYNNFGSPSEMFPIHSECTTLPSAWQHRISSVNTNGNNCVEICPTQDCQGNCMKLKTGSKGHNRLRDINFDNRMKSFLLC